MIKYEQKVGEISTTLETITSEEFLEASYIVEILNIGSQQYKEGKHISLEELKEKLTNKFKGELLNEG